jgi:hypothetical protein
MFRRLRHRNDAVWRQLPGAHEPAGPFHAENDPALLRSPRAIYNASSVPLALSLGISCLHQELPRPSASSPIWIAPFMHSKSPCMSWKCFDAHSLTPWRCFGRNRSSG